MAYFRSAYTAICTILTGWSRSGAWSLTRYVGPSRVLLRLRKLFSFLPSEISSMRRGEPCRGRENWPQKPQQEDQRNRRGLEKEVGYRESNILLHKELFRDWYSGKLRKAETSNVGLICRSDLISSEHACLARLRTFESEKERPELHPADHLVWAMMRIATGKGWEALTLN